MSHVPPGVCETFFIFVRFWVIGLVVHAGLSLGAFSLVFMSSFPNIILTNILVSRKKFVIIFEIAMRAALDEETIFVVWVHWVRLGCWPDYVRGGRFDGTCGANALHGGGAIAFLYRMTSSTHIVPRVTEMMVRGIPTLQ